MTQGITIVVTTNCYVWMKVEYQFDLLISVAVYSVMENNACIVAIDPARGSPPHWQTAVTIMPHAEYVAAGLSGLQSDSDVVIVRGRKGC